MIGMIGALCVGLVSLGGSVLQMGYFFTGLALTSMGAIGLGTVFAIIRSAGQVVSGFETREGLNLRQLHMFLMEAPVTGDTKVYVGDQGLNMAGSIFVCILDGRQTVVIERAPDVGLEGLEVDDLF